MTTAKKICIIVIAAAMVGCFHIVYQLYDTKNYTVDYPKTISDVQENIDSAVTAVEDKVVTKGSVLLLAKTNQNQMRLYHLERGFFTLKYNIKFVWENVEEGSRVTVENHFEKFKADIENGQVVNVPYSFVHKSIDWANLPANWLSPIYLLYVLMTEIWKRVKKE